jgi:hypothetical protein
VGGDNLYVRASIKALHGPPPRGRGQSRGDDGSTLADRTTPAWAGTILYGSPTPGNSRVGGDEWSPAAPRSGGRRARRPICRRRRRDLGSAVSTTTTTRSRGRGVRGATLAHPVAACTPSRGGSVPRAAGVSLASVYLLMQYHT